MNNVFKTVTRLTFLMFMLLAICVPITASAQFDPLEKPCAEVSEQSSICDDNDEARNNNPITGDDGTLTVITNLVALVGGVIAVIVIVVSGISMTLSGGDSQKVANSRNSLIYASIGVVIIVLARGLVLYIINRVA